jgi:hypothetical protein
MSKFRWPWQPDPEEQELRQVVEELNSHLLAQSTLTHNRATQILTERKNDA